MGRIIMHIKEHGVRIALCLAVLLLFIVHAANWLRLGLVDRLENLAYDKRLTVTMPNTIETQIVIVDIDEKSLTAEGRWPWGRDKLAALLEKMFGEYKVGLAGFDIVFAEPDTSSGLSVLESLAASEFKNDSAFRDRLAAIRPNLDYDQVFADAIKKYPVVLGYYFNFGSPGADTAKIGALPAPTFVKGTFTGKNIAFRPAQGFGSNLEKLQRAALGGGHFNPVPDPDGVIRRVPMLIEYEGAYYSALALEMARLALGA
ncbi:MAG: CHASE2 domain-containing protein, partial [Gammaproteobacteria bacterium]